MSIGFDHFRTSMLLAIVERKLGYSFAGEDIYLNVAGGLTIDEPASDLGVIAAIVSCLKNKAVPARLALFGEVGLSGEVRSVPQPLARVKEAYSLGFESVILPQGNISLLEKEDLPQISLAGVQNLRQFIPHIF
jgi:DNA repair protein RadA/Sms